MGYFKNFKTILALGLLVSSLLAGAAFYADSSHSSAGGKDPEIGALSFSSGSGLEPQVTLAAPPPTPPDPVNLIFLYYPQAARITSAAILYVMNTAKPDVNSELDIAGMIDGVFSDEGVPPGPCWTPPIHSIASGINTQYEHHAPTTRKLRYGEVAFVDTGAGYHGACSDVARTFPGGIYFTSRQKQIYGAVLMAMKEGDAGAMLKEPLDQIKGEMWSRLKSYTRINNLKAWDTKTSQMQYLYYFADPNTFVHFIGWGTDVLGAYSGWSKGQPLQRGMAFSLEVGIHIPSEQMGIRIEDMYMVLNNGTVMRLSAGCPREIAEIEKIRQSCLSRY